MNLLQMSISAAVLIAVITILRAVLIHKLPKKTFLFLWGLVLLRLLIPVSIPSPVSIYSWLGRQTPTAEQGARLYSPQIAAAKRITERLAPDLSGQAAAAEHLSVSLWAVIWTVGFLLCLSFFVIAYYRGMKKFSAALPISTAFLSAWKEWHPLKRSLSIRRSHQMTAPLSYGVFRPVILLPEKLDLTNTEVLNYILTHEYVHIRHFDILTKAVMILALSIHWFNPLVWVMFLLLNRDIELVCDETVIRICGEKSRPAYAYTLIDMEIHQAGLMPLCNNFSKNAIEERIGAIMKMKKTSIIALVLTVLLTGSLTLIFATSAIEENQRPASVSAARERLSAEERSMLQALQLAGYEDMSISEYQNKIWKMTDTEEYQALLERVAQDDMLYRQKDSDALASFLFNTLVPLTAENWQTSEFSGSTGTSYSGRTDPTKSWDYDGAALEFTITLAIQKADSLTVREYAATRAGVMNAVSALLRDKTEKQLQDKELMAKEIAAQVEKIKNQWSSERLQVAVECFYMPLAAAEFGEEDGDSGQRYSEPRRYPQGSGEDYQSLLELKTPDYQKMSVADFNKALLEWADRNHERLERVGEDAAFDDYGVSLSPAEKSFITLTVWASGMENAAWVKSSYTKTKEKDPETMIILPDREEEVKDHLLYSSLSYHLAYHIADNKALAAEERDSHLAAVLSGVERFWQEAKTEDILKMTDGEAAEKLKQIAAQNSNEKIVFQIAAEQVHFQKDWDEKSTMTEKQILPPQNTSSARERTESLSDGKAESGSADDSEKTEGEPKSADAATSKASAAEYGVSRTVEEWEKVYSIYKPFGVVYDKNQDCFYYQGKLVRCLIDVMQSNGKSLESGDFKGIMRQIYHPEGKGEVDVYMVRDYEKLDSNGNGTLIGVKESIK